MSGETYGIRGHGHGEQVDDLAPPVRLEHIAGEKTVVDGYDYCIVSRCVLDVCSGLFCVSTYKSTCTPSAWAAATGECTP